LIYAWPPIERPREERIADKVQERQKKNNNREREKAIA
jgi:hypothetical protein